MPLSEKAAMDKSIHSRDYSVFLSLLKNARVNAQVPQTELAERLGVTQVFVSKVERGERRLDLVETLWWCHSLGVSFSEFASTLESGVGHAAKDISRPRKKT